MKNGEMERYKMTKKIIKIEEIKIGSILKKKRFKDDKQKKQQSNLLYEVVNIEKISSEFWITLKCLEYPNNNEAYGEFALIGIFDIQT